MLIVLRLFFLFYYHANGIGSLNCNRLIAFLLLVCSKELHTLRRVCGVLKKWETNWIDVAHRKTLLLFRLARALEWYKNIAFYYFLNGRYYLISIHVIFTTFTTKNHYFLLSVDSLDAIYSKTKVFFSIR